MDLTNDLANVLKKRQPKPIQRQNAADATSESGKKSGNNRAC